VSLDLLLAGYVFSLLFIFILNFFVILFYYIFETSKEFEFISSDQSSMDEGLHIDNFVEHFTMLSNYSDNFNIINYPVHNYTISAINIKVDKIIERRIILMSLK
jgi:hypothetical protein